MGGILLADRFEYNCCYNNEYCLIFGNINIDMQRNKKIENFINRNKEMDKKIDSIIKILENKEKI